MTRPFFTHRSGLALALIPILLLACGPGDAPPAPGLSGPDVPVDVSSQLVYQVGSLDGEEWELFSRVSRVAFDAAGNLYVYDADNARIAVVDPSGSYLRGFGSQGDGPGEFRMPMGMAVFPDGRVTVFDLGHQALVLFGPDGAFQRNVRLDLAHALPGSDMIPHPRGGLVSANTMRMQMGEGEDALEEPTTIPVTYFAMDEAAPRTLYDAWRMPPPQDEAVNIEGGGFQLSARPMVAFEPRPQIAVLPDGRLLLADTTAYRLRILGPDGEPQVTLERSLRPREVTESIREQERARRLGELEESGGPRISMMTDGGGGGSMPSDIGRQIMEQQIASMVFADEIPVIAQVAADWRGRIWVERSGDEIGERGPTDLIRADGTYIGTLPADGLKTPDAFGPDGLAAYIETDDMGIPIVVVRRIGPTP